MIHLASDFNFEQKVQGWLARSQRKYAVQQDGLQPDGLWEAAHTCQISNGNFGDNRFTDSQVSFFELIIHAL